MTTPEEATCLAVEELRERVEGKLSRIIRVWSNDLSTVLDALLAAEARIRVLEEALRSALNMVDGDGCPPDWNHLRALAKPEETP